MAVAEKIIFYVLFLQGVWCADQWTISLPENIEALSGSCVTINCRFTIDNTYESKLTDSAAGVWYKDGTQTSNKVFDSRSNINGRIIGKLKDKNCTTIFYDVSSNHNGKFYFRIEGDGNLKYTYSMKYVSIHVIESPPKPTVKMFKEQMEVQDQEEVLEGSSVNLYCSAETLCSSSPPTLTWSATDRLPLSGSSRLQEQQNPTEIISDLNFTATHLQHGVTFTCTITYQLQHKNSTAESNITLHVQYAPKNTSVCVFPSDSVLEGRSVTLICSSDANPAVLNYTWYRENGEQLEQLQTGHNLTFNVTDRTHTGRYYCRATNQHGTQNTSVLLNIQYAPKNTSVCVFPSDSVLEGRSVTLTCSSDANPAVLNYTWYRENGGQLEQLQTGHNLTFNVTDRTHTGRYYCRATNQHGTQNTSVLLNIQYAPKNTSVCVFPSDSVLEGRSVTLTCSSDANPAVLNYTWYRENGGQLKQLQTGHNLTFNVTDRTHTGRYYCRATNQHGTQNTSVLLNIQYAPKNTSVCVFPSDSVLEGRPVTLTCSSDANPAVFNYTWYRENGGQLEQLQTGHNLTFNVTDRTHTGRYYCQATNQHGTQNTSVLLNIQYAPKNTSVCVFPSDSVLEGRSVTLTCSSDANPAVLNYTWFRDNGGQLEQLQTGHNLTFNVTDRTHTGHYYCRATNQHGSRNTSVLLNIQYAPQISTFSICPHDGVIVYSCEVDGNPSPKVKWHLSGRAVTNSTNTSISEERLSSTGLRSFITLHQSLTHTHTLQCVSTNNHGNTSHQFQLQSVPQKASWFDRAIFIGFAVGALIMGILCVIILMYKRRICRTRREDKTGLVLNDKDVLQENKEEPVYDNKVMLSPDDATTLNYPESLHYSSIDFTNIKTVSGEIRGISSLTAEYAVIRDCVQSMEASKAMIREESLLPCGDATYECITDYQVAHSLATEAQLVLGIGMDVKQVVPKNNELALLTVSDKSDLYAKIKHHHP